MTTIVKSVRDDERFFYCNGTTCMWSDSVSLKAYIRDKEISISVSGVNVSL